MDAAALRLDHVFKRFRRGQLHDSLRDLVPALLRRPRRGEGDALRPLEFWALQDVSFEVAPGETLGIIGHNGAGKSTMLKHLSGVMRPTRGTIEVMGRLSALIEVGAGFHPDLTGRENVFLNGIILGMTRAEIRRKFDEIVAFSGLEEFIDTPVKRYSSGMFARLGFSVAAHLDPEILVIDEVLSVGDYVFQRKGLDKMREVARSGATVLFVSHNLRAVADLCGRCLLLDRGRLVHDGPTDDTIREYLGRGVQEPAPDTAVHVARTTLRGPGGESVRFRSGSRMEIEIAIEARADAPELAVVLEVQDEGCYNVFNTSSERLGHPALTLRAGEAVTCTFELTAHLAPGSYHVAVYLYRYAAQRLYHQVFPAATFFVESETDVRGVANLYPSLREMRIVRPGA